MWILTILLFAADGSYTTWTPEEPSTWDDCQADITDTYAVQYENSTAILSCEPYVDPDPF
jgi:hypothetical protein